MYHIIETLNATNRRSVAYFNTQEEAVEWIEKQREKYKKMGYITHLRKDNYSRAKRHKAKNNVFHLSMRHKKDKIKYISWSIVKLSKDERINKNLASDNIFGDLFGEKRAEQFNLRLSKSEMKILYKLAEKKNTLPAQVLRTAIMETFGKEIENLKNRKK